MRRVSLFTPIRFKSFAFLIVLTAAVIIPTLSSPRVAHAICGTSCTYTDPWGTEEVSGSGWMGSNGVPIYSNGPLAPNGPSPDTYNCVTVPGGAGNLGCVPGQAASGIQWQCVDLVNRLYLTDGWITATWSGNGDQLYGNAPSSLTKEAQGSTTYVSPGDVIGMSKSGTPGHATVISSVSGNSITIASQNTNVVYDSSFKLSGGSITFSGWTGYTVQGVIHHPGSTPPPSKPLRIGALLSSGDYQAKEGALDAGWVDVYPNSVTQGLQDGALTGVVENGGLYVKNGGLGDEWVTQTTSGAVSASISDASGSTPIRVAVVDSDGTFWVKEGNLASTGWVLEQGSVVAGFVSGNRTAALLSDGTFEVKEGTLTAGWVVEEGGVTQAVISGGSGTGSSGQGLLGVIIGGTLYVKSGSLTAGWITEQGGVAKAQLAYTSGSVLIGEQESAAAGLPNREVLPIRLFGHQIRVPTK